MAFNIRSILGRNKVPNTPSTPLPELPLSADRMRSMNARNQVNQPLPPLPKIGMSPSSPAPEIPRTVSGHVDVPYHKVNRDHLGAMADDQLIDHWKKTAFDPNTQTQEKGGLGGYDLEHPMVRATMQELESRKINPFVALHGAMDKSNKFDSTGKMDQKFYQPNRDPNTGVIIHTGKEGYGGNMEWANGKGRVAPLLRQPPAKGK